jgi:hypothetical protein
MPTETDYMRLAAYIDGEGCIGLHGSMDGTGQRQLKLAISNTDFRLPIWCHRTFGGRLVPETKDRDQNFDKLGWHINSKKAADILKQCLPHFIIKREEAELAIAFQATKHYHRNNPIPQEVRELRDEMAGKMRLLKRTRLTMEEALEKMGA